MEMTQRQIMREGGYLTVTEAAKRTGVNAATIYRMITAKKLTTAKTGQMVYVLAQSLADHYREAAPIYDRIMAGVGEGAQPIDGDEEDAETAQAAGEGAVATA